ncbi:MAG: response regulator [Pseudomonadota bacterium]
MASDTIPDAPAPTGATPPRPTLKPGEKVQALILDDSNFDRKRLRRIARQTGVPIEFTDAASLIAFAKFLDERTYQLVFIDYRLPEGDGLEALRLLEEHPVNRDAHAIMVAGDLDADVVAQAFKKGCADYVAKQKMDTRTLRHSILAALAGTNDGR